VQLAFFGGFGGPQTEPDVPTGEITNPEIAVSIGSVLNLVQVSGAVAQDPAVTVVSTLTGTVSKVLVTNGQWVEAGTPLYTIRQETVTPEGQTRVKTETVLSPIPGTLTLAVLATEMVTINTEGGSVQPSTFNVSGAVPPEQLFRLLTLPPEATVAITGGPAPFICPALRLGSASADPGTGSTGSTTITCNVPADVRVFVGLQASIDIPAGEAVDVLVLPTTAVEGLSETGNVWFVLPDGSTEVRPVTLGLTDGSTVQIIDGLVEGDRVLQFIPGAASTTGFGPSGLPLEPGPDGCYDDGTGGVICEQGIGG
jgi:multidrug efflux pump subunit AcrA (membrane-fusion protein)